MSELGADRGILKQVMLSHLLRLACFALLIIGLHQLAARSPGLDSQATLDMATLQQVIPGAVSMVPNGDPPIWEVRDAAGEPIALVCMTSPYTDEIVGYAGPNNVLIEMDLQGRVQQTHWLRWLDTHDHVERVRSAEEFWKQFRGRSLGQSDVKRIDGVSGATLTSLAIAEAIDMRLSGTRPSLRFPASLETDEVQGLYPEAVQLQDDPDRAFFTRVLDKDHHLLGWVVRTGPLADSQIGYQGPTELLLAIDKDDRLTKVKLRRSFDNEPYVKYTRMEASFWAKFHGRSLTEISQMNWEEEAIEGVSGATMTSMAAADTVREAARKLLDHAARAGRPSSVARNWNWSIGELSTAMLAVLLIPWSMSRWRGNRRNRAAWQLIAFIVVVGISGNLISMALLAGWTRSLPPITLAPGLGLLVLVSLAMPALFGRNVYCDHVCPHGMVQQWMARWMRRRPAAQPLVQLHVRSLDKPAQPQANKLRGKLQHALRWSAAIILLSSMSWIVWTLPKQLTFFEPFDVYAWRIGWSVSLGVWLASLLLASKEPMGYCRFACPTGMLLEGIRRKRTGRSWRWADMLLLALTLVTWLFYVWQ